MKKQAGVTNTFSFQRENVYIILLKNIAKGWLLELVRYICYHITMTFYHDSRH